MERSTLTFARRVMPLLGIAAILATGCGARTQPNRPVAHTEQPSALAEESTSPAPAQSGAPSEGATAAPTSGAPDQAPASTPGDTVRPSPPPNNGMRVEIAKACVSPGDTQVITLRVPRRAGVTMVIAYADRGTHGHMNHGVADDDGVYVWNIVLPPDVPAGPARVGATSTGANWIETGGEGNSGQAFGEFEVRPPGQCGT